MEFIGFCVRMKPIGCNVSVVDNGNVVVKSGGAWPARFDGAQITSCPARARNILSQRKTAKAMVIHASPRPGQRGGMGNNGIGRDVTGHSTHQNTEHESNAQPSATLSMRRRGSDRGEVCGHFMPHDNQQGWLIIWSASHKQKFARVIR